MDTNHDQRNDGPHDEEADKRHNSVDMPPPSGTLVLRFVEEQPPGSIDLAGSETAFAHLGGFSHVQFGLRRQWKQRGEDPGYASEFR